MNRSGGELNRRRSTADYASAWTRWPRSPCRTAQRPMLHAMPSVSQVAADAIDAVLGE
jgi:hypothetical protein